MTEEEKTIDEVCGSIADNFSKENINRNKDLYDLLLPMVGKCKFPLAFAQISFDIDDLLQSAIGKKKIQEKEANFWFLYKFIRCHLSNFIKMMDGNVCCVDKTMNLLKRYEKFIQGTPIEDLQLVRKEDVYTIPEFGTIGDWFFLIETLMGLYYGYYGDYCKAIYDICKLKLKGDEKNESQ